MSIIKRLYAMLLTVQLDNGVGNDTYHLSFSFHAQDIGFIHLISANTPSPRIEGFEVNKDFARNGLGTKLVMAIPRYYRKKHLPLDSIRVALPTTDLKKREEIYKKISNKLFKKYGIQLEIEYPARNSDDGRSPKNRKQLFSTKRATDKRSAIWLLSEGDIFYENGNEHVVETIAGDWDYYSDDYYLIDEDGRYFYEKEFPLLTKEQENYYLFNDIPIKLENPY